MPAKEFDADTAQSFIDRFAQVNEDSERQWGTMTSAEMMAHLKLSVQGGLGEIPVKDRSNFVIRALVPVLFSGLLPMPKGRAKTAPEYEVATCESFEDEKQGLLDVLQRFLEHCENEPDSTPLHPLFGHMTIAQWQRGHALHFEHHLKQFGV